MENVLGVKENSRKRKVKCNFQKSDFTCQGSPELPSQQHAYCVEGGGVVSECLPGPH